MLKYLFSSILFFVVITNFIIKTNSQEICELNEQPSFCELCNDDQNDYSECIYENLYCILSKGKNLYSKCKKLYSRFLRNNIHNDNFCGNKEIIFINNNYSQTIFQIRNENQNNANNLQSFHCDYDLKLNNLNDSLTNKINITISIGNAEIENYNDFNFFFFLLKNSIFNADNLITKEKMVSNQKVITLEYFKNISLYLDINFLKNKFPDFYIKIDYFNIENEEGEEIKMEKEDMYPLYLTLYIAIPLLVLLIALIIYLCCKKQDTGILGGEIRVIGFANNENEFMEEGEDRKSKTYKLNENKKKLMLLFKTILGAQEYTKSHKAIDCPKCTICYDDFELYNSVVSITPCQHIFHYRCLHNWLNKNAMNNPKCPNCNFDLMNIDIKKFKQKMQMQNSSAKTSIKREGSINENLLSNNNLKNSSNNDSNNINNINSISLNRNKKENYITMNNNPRAITISHISINYSSDKKNKSNEGNENESDDDSESENEIENGNICNSQNCLNNDEDKKENNNYKNNKKENHSDVIIDNNNINSSSSNMSIKNIINKKKKKRIIITTSENINENNENIDKNNINEDNIDNKSNLSKTYSLASQMISESKNNTSQKREGYKTLNQEMINSTRRSLN